MLQPYDPNQDPRFNRQQPRRSGPRISTLVLAGIVIFGLVFAAGGALLARPGGSVQLPMVPTSTIPSLDGISKEGETKAMSAIELQKAAQNRLDSARAANKTVVSVKGGKAAAMNFLLTSQVDACVVFQSEQLNKLLFIPAGTSVPQYQICGTVYAGQSMDGVVLESVDAESNSIEVRLPAPVLSPAGVSYDLQSLQKVGESGTTPEFLRNTLFTTSDQVLIKALKSEVDLAFRNYACGDGGVLEKAQSNIESSVRGIVSLPSDPAQITVRFQTTPIDKESAGCFAQNFGED